MQEKSTFSKKNFLNSKNISPDIEDFLFLFDLNTTFLTCRAAWFECVYHMLQCSKLLEVLTPQKSQLITTSFQFIDDADPLVAPHVWGCVLLLQSNYDDWYDDTIK